MKTADFKFPGKKLYMYIVGISIIGVPLLFYSFFVVLPSLYVRYGLELPFFISLLMVFLMNDPYISEMIQFGVIFWKFKGSSLLLEDKKVTFKKDGLCREFLLVDIERIEIYQSYLNLSFLGSLFKIHLKDAGDCVYIYEAYDSDYDLRTVLCDGEGEWVSVDPRSYSYYDSSNGSCGEELVVVYKLSFLPFVIPYLNK